MTVIVLEIPGKYINPILTMHTFFVLEMSVAVSLAFVGLLLVCLFVSGGFILGLLGGQGWLLGIFLFSLTFFCLFGLFCKGSF